MSDGNLWLRLWRRIASPFSRGQRARSHFVETTIMGVPNLAQVAPRVWRCGQPQLPMSWRYLRDQLGPSVTVVKLNDAAEGVDELPEGWTLMSTPIPPEDDAPWTIFAIPSHDVVQSIIDAIIRVRDAGGTVLIHCTHGRDRTGLISALVGTRIFGWTKKQAWEDMLVHGFRWELPGLDAFWLDAYREDSEH